MIFFWTLYYLLLFSICFLFTKITKNKFIKFFIIPLIFGLFGSFWFAKPGSSEVAPIISIILLESSIIDSNGLNRLFRPLITFIFLFELISFFYYLYLKRNNH